MTTTLTPIPIDSIERGDNDRQSFDQVALEELSESIRTHGLVQPITIRPMGHGHYQIVAGERRWRACKLLRWVEIPAIVRDLDDEAASAIMLAENIGRKDLNPIEEATAYHRRMERFGWCATRVADVAAVSHDLVRRRLSLLRLVPQAQKLVASGQFPVGHGQAMADLDNNRQRIALRVYGHSSGMTLRAFRRVVSDLLQEQSQDALFDLQEFWVQQVQAEAQWVGSGKNAKVDVPKAPDLPLVQVAASDSIGEVFVRYIGTLQAAGYQQEAGAIGNLFERLVKGNWLSLPRPNASQPGNS